VEIRQAYKFKLRANGSQARAMAAEPAASGSSTTKPWGCENRPLKDLESAYKNFLKARGRFPKFKRLGESESVG
jgi:hypothetical protein